MKQFKSYFAFLLIIFACISLTACSDDDGPKGGDDDNAEEVVNPKQVFENGIPKQVGDMQITTNAQGLVTEIVDGDKTATFIYNEEGSGTKKIASRAPKNYDVKMVITNRGVDIEVMTLYLTLNEQKFVKYAYEEYSRPDLEGSAFDEWWFEYNSAGQLKYMKRTEGNNEVTTITYDDGNITDVSYQCDRVDPESDEGDNGHYSVTYGSTPIANIGGIMMYDECFGIDTDEMQFSYYAGMLGKATKDLPIKLTDKKYPWHMDFEWSMNPKGLPIQLRAIEDGRQEYAEIFNFKW